MATPAAIAPFDEVESIYTRYQAASSNTGDLAADFEERFGQPLDSIADVPRMVIVAAHLDDSTERMIELPYRFVRCSRECRPVPTLRW